MTIRDMWEWFEQKAGSLAATDSRERNGEVLDVTARGV